MTLEDAKKGLERALERQYVHECANDMYYYSSQQYRDDQEEIKHWEMLIKELKESKKS